VFGVFQRSSPGMDINIAYLVANSIYRDAPVVAYSPKFQEEVFCELHMWGVLRSSPVGCSRNFACTEFSEVRRRAELPAARWRVRAHQVNLGDEEEVRKQ
jgi:hypothetical protein